MGEDGCTAIWRGEMDDPKGHRYFVIVGRPRMLGGRQPLVSGLSSVVGYDLSYRMRGSCGSRMGEGLLCLAAWGSIGFGTWNLGREAKRELIVSDLDLVTIVPGPGMPQSQSGSFRDATHEESNQENRRSRCVLFSVALGPSVTARDPKPDGGPWIDLVAPSGIEQNAREWRGLLGDWMLRVVHFEANQPVVVPDEFAEGWLQVITGGIQGRTSAASPEVWFRLNSGDGKDLASCDKSLPAPTTTRRSTIAVLSRAHRG